MRSDSVKIRGGSALQSLNLVSRLHKAWLCLAGTLLLAPLHAFAAVPITITISPTSVNLIPNGTQQFTATVTGASDTSVTWTIQEGATGGSISAAGLYSAPASVGIYHVIATSNAASTLSATATVGVPGFLRSGLLYPGPCTGTLLSNGTILFTGGRSGNGSPSTNAEIYDPVAGKSTTTGSMTVNRCSETATLLADGKVLFAGGESGGQTATAEVYDPVAGTFASTGSMSVARTNHTATLLSNGTVLITGGGNCNSSCVTFNTAEIYNPGTGLFTPTSGAMAAALSGSSATLLASGKVLIAGGATNGSTGTTLAQLYDPSTGMFTPTGSMGNARSQYFTATLLQNGRVLFVGGLVNGATTSTAEIYDPTTQQFSPTGSLNEPLDGHSATLLVNGQVLISGGTSTTTFANASELYDPVAGTFSATGSLEEPRFSPWAALLSNGTVIVAGGNLPAALGSVEIYDPVAGSFSSNSTFMNFSRTGSTMTKLADGKYLVVGGIGPDLNPVSRAEVFDPATNKFTLTGALATGRQMHTATLLGDGTVLVVGGFADWMQSIYVTTAEIYNPVSGTFGAAPSNPNMTRANHTATLLPGGKVLITGGQFSNAPFATTSVELYDPVAGTFTLAGNMNAPRANHTATLLSDGRVLIAEGLYPGPSLQMFPPDELYDVSTGSFTPVGTPLTGSSAAPRPTFDSLQWPSGQILVDISTLLDPTSLILSALSTNVADGITNYKFVLLPSDQVFVVGGGGTGNLAFLLNPNPPVLPQQSLPTYLVAGSLEYARQTPSTALLPNKEVLIAAGAYVREAEFYVAPVAESDPVISSITPDPITGFSPVAITINGSNFATDASISLDFNGAPIQTTFVSSTQLTATIPAIILTFPGAHTVVVQNGIGFSSAQFTLNVNNPALSESEPNGSGISYGTIPAGTSSSQSVIFTNSGNLPLTIDSLSISGINSADFKFDSVNTSCPLQGGVLAAKQSCTATIEFQPLSDGAFTAAMNLAYEQLPGSPFVVPLSGTGTGQVSSTITPTTLTFGNQAVGTTSQPQSLTVTNTGTTNWNIAGVALSDITDFSTSNNCPVNLTPAASCSISITFNPATLGSLTGSAVITSNQATPYTIPLSGAGVNFSLSVASGSSTSATVAAGQTATYQLTLAPQAFTGSVELTCAPVAAIPNATCSVAPNPATVSGSSPTVVTVTVVTTARSGNPSPYPAAKGPLTALWAFLATHWVFFRVLGFVGISLALAAFKPRRARIGLAAAFLVATLALGCGSSSSSSTGGGSTPGTTAGNYQLLVTATAAGASHTITLNLTVQ